MVIKMKQQATSKPFFDQSTIDAALSAAQDLPVDDALNPVTSAKDWTGVVVSSSLQDFTQKMAAKRVRGSQKKPLKVPTTIRFDADLLEALKASGKGWQTLVNDAMRDWIKNHKIAH